MHFVHCVAPLVGAWIEIITIGVLIDCQKVAPLVGAWIEMSTMCVKSQYRCVAPLVGAWIEIRILLKVPCWQ